MYNVVHSAIRPFLSRQKFLHFSGVSYIRWPSFPTLKATVICLWFGIRCQEFIIESHAPTVYSTQWDVQKEIEQSVVKETGSESVVCYWLHRLMLHLIRALVKGIVNCYIEMCKVLAVCLVHFSDVCGSHSQCILYGAAYIQFRS